MHKQHHKLIIFGILIVFHANTFADMKSFLKGVGNTVKEQIVTPSSSNNSSGGTSKQTGPLTDAQMYSEIKRIINNAYQNDWFPVPIGNTTYYYIQYREQLDTNIARELRGFIESQSEWGDGNWGNEYHANAVIDSMIKVTRKSKFSLRDIQTPAFRRIVETKDTLEFAKYYSRLPTHVNSELQLKSFKSTQEWKNIASDFGAIIGKYSPLPPLAVVNCFFVVNSVPSKSDITYDINSRKMFFNFNFFINGYIDYPNAWYMSADNRVVDNITKKISFQEVSCIGDNSTEPLYGTDSYYSSTSYLSGVFNRNTVRECKYANTTKYNRILVKNLWRVQNQTAKPYFCPPEAIAPILERTEMQVFFVFTGNPTFDASLGWYTLPSIEVAFMNLKTQEIIWHGPLLANSAPSPASLNAKQTNTNPSGFQTKKVPVAK